MPFLLESNKRSPRRKKKKRWPYILAALVLAVALGGLLWFGNEAGNRRSIENGNPALPQNSGITNPAPTPSAVPKEQVAPGWNSPPAVVTVPVDKPISSGFEARGVQNVLEAQLALARLGISPGSLDGAAGSQTRAALRVFQSSRNLAANGVLDSETRQELRLSTEPYTNYIITSNDLARLRPLALDWIGKSKQTALDYETILELVAEKGWSHPGLIKQLNPEIDWATVAPGTVVRIPNVERPPGRRHAAFLQIKLSEKTLEAFDAETNVLLHFPCSIAQRVEKRPVGELHVAVVALNPDYLFDPANFPESEEAQKIGHKLWLPPGPKNPVGTAWIGLDKPGYGIHGSPRPEQVGRTESHGCFRLANWNAELLARLVTIGMPVYVIP